MAPSITLLPLCLFASRRRCHLRHRERRGALELSMYVILLRLVRRRRRGSWSNPARGGSSPLAGPPPSTQDLLAVPHSPVVALVVPVEQLVLAERADPLVRRVRQRRRHWRHARLRFLPPPRRDLRGQKPQGQWREHILCILHRLLRVGGPAVRQARGHVVPQVVRIRGIGQCGPFLLLTALATLGSKQGLLERTLWVRSLPRCGARSLLRAARTLREGPAERRRSLLRSLRRLGCLPRELSLESAMQVGDLLVCRDQPIRGFAVREDYSVSVSVQRRPATH